MCGLAVILLAHCRRNNEDFDNIWEIFSENLVQNEQRGKEATGVCIINRDNSFKILKLPIPASEFIKREEYKKNIRKAFNKNTFCIMGHTRKPTKGSVGYSNNNHPIETENIIGIHNGNIKNDDNLFENIHISRKGEVDSEAIFALLGTIPENITRENYCKEISLKVKTIEGNMTTVSFDRRHSNEILLLKRDIPFSMHYEKIYHSLFFSSRYVFLRKAFGRSVITEALESKKGYIFRADDFENIPQRYSSIFKLNNPERI